MSCAGRESAPLFTQHEGCVQACHSLLPSEIQLRTDGFMRIMQAHLAVSIAHTDVMSLQAWSQRRWLIIRDWFQP